MTSLKLVCVTLLLGVCFANAQVFSIDLSKPTTPFPHFWEQCVGSGHALLGLRSDWQAHLLQAHEDLGFQQVRFHGLFDDDMSALLVVDGKPTFSWFNIDTVFDFLLSIGMQPYVELSFMPEYLASGTASVMHYKGLISPPNNYTLWGEFLQGFASHIIDRYGWGEISQWSFEVWNEPNCGFFNGTQAEYFTLFQHTITALKSVNRGIRVGGPATCQSAWLPDFIKFCTQNNLSYDFISTHEYPTDLNPSNRDVLLEVFTKARTQVGPNATLYYSEFNDGLYNSPAYHDTPYASSFLFHTLHQVQGIVDLMSWWTFTDIFEEQGQTSQPYFGVNGWGLLNMYQVPKPAYRAFEILHDIGTNEVPVVASANSTAGVWAILTNSATLDIIAYNFDLPDSSIENVTITIQISNLQSAPSYGYLYRIDDEHANAPATWIAQGSPAYPTQEQIADQLYASTLNSDTLPAEKSSQTSIQFSLSLPKWGSALLRVPLN